MTNLVLRGVRLLSRIPYLRLSVYDMRNSSCIRRSLSLFSVFACQSSIPRQITLESDIIHTAVGCECNCCQMNRFLSKTAISILSESHSVASWERICHEGITGVAQARKHFLTFRGTATGSESPFHSTFIYAISLPPEIFTRPRQDANDLLFVLRPLCNVIIVRTLLASGLCLQDTHSAKARWCFSDRTRKR